MNQKANVRLKIFQTCSVIILWLIDAITVPRILLSLLAISVFLWRVHSLNKQFSIESKSLRLSWVSLHIFLSTLYLVFGLCQLFTWNWQMTSRIYTIAFFEPVCLIQLYVLLLFVFYDVSVLTLYHDPYQFSHAFNGIDCGFFHPLLSVHSREQM